MRAILAAVALSIAAPVTPAIASGQNAVQPLTVTRLSEATTATCTLIHRDDRAEGVVLYFITAGRVFRTAEGERLPIAESVIVGRGTRAIGIRAQDILLPTGNLVDVALLRATVPHAELQPERIAWDPPEVGGALVVSGFDRSGAASDLAQHARFASTLLLVGDRDVSGLDGCMGAPATAAAGLFAVVTSCDAGRTPLMTLLRPARSFISHYIPMLATAPTTSHLTIGDRDVAGPALDIPCTRE